jgi:acetyltransferase-like isoleucine patch superfamily enzyme
MNDPWLSRAGLAALGLAACGEEVWIHPSCVLIAPERLSIGSHVRIDPFCVLSAGGGMRLGSRVHIGPHVSLSGRAPIQIDDHVNLSHGVRVFSTSDDFAAGLAGPMVPERFRAVLTAPVKLGRHSLVGANAVLLPGAVLGEGAAVGALSLVKGELEGWWIHAGCPTRPLRRRDRDTVLALQRRLEEEALPEPPAGPFP